MSGLGLASVALIASAVLMARVIVLDIAVRLIPTRSCIAIALLGAVFQFALFGLPGVRVSFFSTLAVLLACRVVQVVGGRVFKGASIGEGDVRCMAALAMVTGSGCACGAFACGVCASLWALVQRVRGKLLPGEAFAYAPFLGVWFVVGSATCLLI